MKEKEKILKEIAKKIKENDSFSRIIGTKILEQHEKEKNEARKETAKAIFDEIEKENGKRYDKVEIFMPAWKKIKENFMKKERCLND